MSTVIGTLVGSPGFLAINLSPSVGVCDIVVYEESDWPHARCRDVNVTYRPLQDLISPHKTHGCYPVSYCMSFI